MHRSVEARQGSICTVIRHVQIEDLGYLGASLEDHGIRFRYLDAQALREPGHELPSGPLIVLGGPMGAYELDKHPFLASEIEVIRRQLERGEPLLGVCLGAQLLAAAGGGRVYPGARGKEIGWAPVELTEAGTADRLWQGFPRRFDTFHWHGDTFDLPAGAEVLARTARYPQAFRLAPRAYGVQFHPEVVPQQLVPWIRAYRLELERERLKSRDVLDVPDEGAHRAHAVRFGRNLAAILKS